MKSDVNLQSWVAVGTPSRYSPIVRRKSPGRKEHNASVVVGNSSNIFSVSFTKEEGETLGAHLGASVACSAAVEGCGCSEKLLPTTRVKHSLLKEALGQTRMLLS